MKIRDFQCDDTQALLDIYVQSILAIDEGLYTAAQKRAWANELTDLKVWQERFIHTLPWVAVNGVGRPIGFIELRPHQYHDGTPKEHYGYIDCLFIHPDHQRQGIAQALFVTVMNEATSQNLKYVYVHTSKSAKAFFDKNGFEIIEVQLAKRQGEMLEHWLMMRTNKAAE